MTRAATPRRAVAAAPSYDALVRHADALRRRGAYTEAVQAFHAITLQFPQRSDAFANLAGMLQASGHPRFALEAITRAIELDPTSVSALRNSAEIMKDFGEWDAVRETYDAALSLAPADAALRFARALHLLTLGEWREGWREHEQRWLLPDLPLTTARLTTPPWDGAPLDGRRILLDHEQGLGDQIMCARFATAVAERGGRVTMRCSAPLAALFAQIPGVDAVVVDGAPIPAHDVRASVMSLPFLLGIDAPELLSGAPYLAPVEPCPDALRRALTATGARVGLVWAGNPQHRNDARRSVTPSLLAPLLDVQGVEFVSVQRHDGGIALPDVLQHRVRDQGGQLRTFNETAHALMQLDLLVTVDTSVAHLAGALGVPTLLLLPFVPDWRWMVHRTDTPWYQSVELIRQSTLFDWTPVIATARARIHALAGAAPCR
jgi:hypothetical protein